MMLMKQLQKMLPLDSTESFCVLQHKSKMLLLFKRTLAGVCTVCWHAALGHKDYNTPNPCHSHFSKLCVWALMMLTMCAVCAAVFRCYIIWGFCAFSKNKNKTMLELFHCRIGLPCLMSFKWHTFWTCHCSKSTGLRITFTRAAELAVSDVWKFQFPSWVHSSLIGMAYLDA